LVIDDREKVEPYFSSLLSQGRLQTAAREANSSGPQKHVVNDEKYNIEKKTANCVYEISVNLEEYNISGDNRIT